LDIYIQLTKGVERNGWKVPPPKKVATFVVTESTPFLPLPFFLGRKNQTFQCLSSGGATCVPSKAGCNILPTPDIECFRRPDFSRTERSPVDWRETERLDENVPFFFVEGISFHQPK